MAKKVNSSEFKSEVLDHKGVVLVDFFATWCGPCKALTPIVDKLSEEMSGKVKIVKVDIDENSALATEYRVMSVPTMKLFKNGEVVETLVGLRPESELRDKLNYYSAEYSNKKQRPRSRLPRAVLAGAFLGHGFSLDKNFYNIQAFIKQHHIGELAGFQTAQTVRLTDDAHRIDSRSLYRACQRNAKGHSVSQTVHKIGN